MSDPQGSSSDAGSSEPETPLDVPSYLQDGGFTLDSALVDFHLKMESLRADVQAMRELDVDDGFPEADMVDIEEVQPDVVQEEMTYLRTLRAVEDDGLSELKYLREQELRILRKRATNHIILETERMDKEYYKLLTRTKEQERRSRESIHRSWQANEDTLIKDSQSGGGVLRRRNTSNRWVTEWSRAPQAILISIHALRNVKDKLGKGRFVLHLELVEVLGGNTIAYVSREVNECEANTRPVHHLGKYYTHDMVFNQTVRMVYPSSNILRSHIVLKWELWRLESGRYDPLDRNVAWGAWPLVDGEFRVQTGDFKMPMLIGASRTRGYDTFNSIQKDIEQDLSLTAGNLYFSVWEDRERDIATAEETKSMQMTVRHESRSHSAGGTVRWGTNLAHKRASENEAWMEGRETASPSGSPRGSMEGSTLRNRASPSPGRARTSTDAARRTPSPRPSATPAPKQDDEDDSPTGAGMYGDLLAELDDEIEPSPARDSPATTRTKKKVSLAMAAHPPVMAESPPVSDYDPAEKLPGPDRKAGLASGGRIAGMEEANRAGAVILSKHAFLCDLKPPPPTGGKLAEKNHFAASALLSVMKKRKARGREGEPVAPRKVKFDEKVHYMQLVGDKAGHWAKVRSVEARVVHDFASHDELDAGEAEVEDDCVPGNEDHLGSTLGGKELCQAADALPVLKKLQYAQQTTAMLNKTDQTSASALDSSVFMHSVTGRREFMKVRRFFREKLPFLQSVIFFDTGVNPTGRWDMLKVFNAVLIFLVMVHVGLYVHQFGLWLHFSWYTVYYTVDRWYPLTFKVDQDSWLTLTPFVQLFAACVGQATCLALLVVFLGVQALIQRIFRHFPYQLSRAVFWYSVYCVIDPVLILVIDVCTQRWVQGDIFILYHMFNRENRAGVLGVMLGMALYFQMCLIAAVLWYRYTVGYHLNGRTEDIFLRVLSPESSFFTPYDTEVSKKEMAKVVGEAENWRSEAGDVKKIVCEEATDVSLCLFRERLWVLLYLRKHYADAEPKRWLQVYFNNIVLSRPERVRCVHNLGSHRLGNDIQDYLAKKNPTLVNSQGYLRQDREHDDYYDEEYLRLRSGLKAHEADLAEQKYVLLRYFEPQVLRYPVEIEGGADDEDERDGVDDEAACRAFEEDRAGELRFRVTNQQLLADLIFFETGGRLLRDGAARRLKRLRHYLGKRLTDAPLSLSKFSLASRFLSCAVKPVKAGFITIYIQAPGGSGDGAKRRQVFRSFVLLPNGAMVEAMPSGYLFDPTRHTADHPEYWIYRSLCRHAQQQHQRALHDNDSTPPLTPGRSE